MTAWLTLLTLSAAAPPDFQTWAARREVPAERPERMANYHWAAEIWQEIAALQQESPQVVHVESIGRSVNKHPIWAVRVSDPGTPVRAKVLVTSQLHALEWIGAEVSLNLLHELAGAPPDHVEVWVVPIANPDGRGWAERDMVDDAVRAFRRTNANGVDLNRDWAVHREPDTWLWPRLPITKRFYGTSPDALSQPETQAIADLAVAQGFTGTVDLHSYGGYVEIPWAGRYEATPDNEALMALAYEMAEAMPNRPYRVIQVCHFVRVFRALGAEVDHMYAVHGADAFLIELTRTGLEVRDPSTWRDTFRMYNPADPLPDVQDGTAAVQTLVRHYSFRARTEEGPILGHRASRDLAAGAD
jgi:hypothetical protein